MSLGDAARKVAEAPDLPIQPNGAHEAGAGDLIVGDGLGAEGGGGIVDGGEDTAAIKEAMHTEAAIRVKPDDLAGIVDAGCSGAEEGQRIVEGGVNAAAQEEPVLTASVVKASHDLAGVVETDRHGAVGLRAGRIVEGGVNAAAQEEAMEASRVRIVPDDLTPIVDPGCLGAGGSR